MDAQEKTRKLSRLDSIRIKGVQAEALLEGLKPFMNELREEYINQLVMHARADGKPHELSNYRLVALKDIEDLLKARLQDAAAAAKRMDKIAGGSE